MHKHGNSCYKNKFLPDCRFRKPESIYDKSQWNDTSEKLELKKSNGMINNYNHFLTLITGSNTDIQFCSNSKKISDFLIQDNANLDIILYLTNYITKSTIGQDSMDILKRVSLESAITTPLAMKANLSKNANRTLSFLMKFQINVLRTSQIASNEIVTKLLNLPMHYTNTDFATIFLQSVIPKIDQFFVDLENGTERNSFEMLSSNVRLTTKGKVKFDMLEDYLYRDLECENLSWYAYISLLEETEKDSQFPFVYPHRYYNKRGMKLRDKLACPVIFGLPNFKESTDNDEQQIIQKKRLMNLLFVPFRKFIELDYENELNDWQRLMIKNTNLLEKSKEQEDRREMNFIPILEIDNSWDEASQKENLDHQIFELEDGIDLNGLFQTFQAGDIEPLLHVIDPIFDLIIQSIQRQPVIEYVAKKENQTIKFAPTWRTIIKQFTPEIQIEAAHTFNDHAAETNVLQIETAYPHDIIRDVKTEFSLNYLQIKVIDTVMKACMNNDSTQMYFYMGGEGGTGKSRVVHAITEIFKRIGISDQLAKMAFTATAAYNIQGRTVHASFGLGINDKAEKEESADEIVEQNEKWSTIRLNIIDEISTAPYKLIQRIDKKLKKVLKNEKLFGGIHTLILGDFKQHLAIGGSIFLAKELWDSLTGATILKEQMRAKGDEKYVQFLNILKQRKATQIDLDYLMESHINNYPNIDLNSEVWKNAQYIVPGKELGHEINKIRTRNYASQLNLPLHIIHAQDFHLKKPITNSTIKNCIASMPTTSDLSRILICAIGSKMVLTHNVENLKDYGITNGSTGTIVSFCTDNMKYGKPIYLENLNAYFYQSPPIAIFKPDRLDDKLNELRFPYVPAGCIPIFPKTNSFEIAKGKMGRNSPKCNYKF